WRDRTSRCEGLAALDLNVARDGAPQIRQQATARGTPQADEVEQNRGEAADRVRRVRPPSGAARVTL
ncbi:MAG: hypothetical protein JW767_04395, partial [Thermoleophilia bacterium]|nr:hypothetical protein [Thermoleophilia bacterium]